MTEEEALEKDCPFTFNRPDADGGAERCIGSSCMAWRDLFTLTNAEEIAAGGIGVPAIMKKDGGYCGLAGRP